MVKLEKRLVSEGVVSQRSYGRGNPVDHVVVHQTGNTNKGANAEMHARLQTNLNPRQASWHEQVDDVQAIQSFDDDVQCWAAGDGRGPGNTRGYHIEICINSDGDYKKAVENGAKRAAAKLKEHGLGIDQLKQHADFANKNCPAQLRAGKEGITWADFVEMVKGFMTGEVKPSKPSTPSKPAPSKDTVVWVGTSNKGKRVESIYKGSDKLNFYDGPRWNNPTGTFGFKEGWTIDNLYRVNGSLMYRVQNSKGDLYYITASEKYVRVVGNSAPATKNVTSYKGDSIVDYLNLKGNKHLGGSSFNNRKKLAERYGIKNYRGTAEQNTLLLKKLRG